VGKIAVAPCRPNSGLSDFGRGNILQAILPTLRAHNEPQASINGLHASR